VEGARPSTVQCFGQTPTSSEPSPATTASRRGGLGSGEVAGASCVPQRRDAGNVIICFLGSRIWVVRAIVWVRASKCSVREHRQARRWTCSASAWMGRLGSWSRRARRRGRRRELDLEGGKAGGVVERGRQKTRCS
jgi:hypothetical protein